MATSPVLPLVFNHIPKCAGTSVRTALLEALQPASDVYFLDFSLVGGYDKLEDAAPALQAKFVRRPADLPDAELVTGHISPGTTQVRYPGVAHVTILRNPACRVISQWVHSRSMTEIDLRNWGPAYPTRIARRPLAEYLQHAMIAPNIDNTITRFLVWPEERLSPTSFIDPAEDDALFDAAMARLDSFHHVNVVENRQFMAELGASLGVELEGIRLNDRASYPPVVATDLTSEMTPETRELLEQRTRIDRRVWTAIAQRVLPDADPAAVLAEGLADSVRRYSAMPAAPRRGGVARRTAERVLRAKARLDPRLKGFR
ncbi:hypothetical protein [Nocardioides sp. AE5]|uniref:hypothetical protein n=1 Tax=Nocardioides sp. AE5 TaxID=2962573 RepID=UPI0028827C55|nr:hypothetical protein [Nocardioides sp. AE5]MDT0202571.1 sulfotransferase family 2 domain-containing protein [Nocardioides sp. AE5]